MKRGEVAQFAHGRLGVCVDLHGLVEALAAVDDAVADRVGFTEPRLEGGL